MHGDPRAARCPQCGGGVPEGEEDGAVTCGHCGSQLFVETTAARHHWVAPALSPAEATGRVRRFLAGRESAGWTQLGLGRLLFFPFWCTQGPHGPRIEPAASTWLDDLDDLRLPPGDRRDFDLQEVRALGEVVPAEPPPADLEAADLVHLPFHEVRFRVSGQAHENVAWVEASDGRVLVDAAPPTRERALDRIYTALLLLLSLALAAASWLLWTGGWATALGLLLLAGGGPLAVRAVRRFVRTLEPGR